MPRSGDGLLSKLCVGASLAFGQFLPALVCLSRMAGNLRVDSLLLRCYALTCKGMQVKGIHTLATCKARRRSLHHV